MPFNIPLRFEEDLTNDEPAATYTPDAEGVMELTGGSAPNS